MHLLTAIFIFAAYMIVMGIKEAGLLGMWAGYLLDEAE